MSNRKPRFTFTDDGCRTEVRVGALLVAGSVFMWLLLGPFTASMILAPGLALLLWGVPVQAIQARQGRPGYPWKLALAMGGLGAAMAPDLTYRITPGGPLHVQEVAIFLAIAGGWMLLWWPVAVVGVRSSPRPSSASSIPPLAQESA